MTLRVAITGIALVAMTAGNARAQQPAALSLAEVARQAEAAQATVKKAKKSYTNADLSAAPSSEPAPPTGFMSSLAGKPASAEKVVATSPEKADQAAAAKQPQQQSEEQWRGRATALRTEIEKLQTRLTMLTKPNPTRDANAAAKERNDGVVAILRSSLDGQRKSWARLEDSARESKVPTAWLDPRPQFQQ